MCQQHTAKVWALTFHHSSIHMLLCICNIGPPVTDEPAAAAEAHLSLGLSHVGPGGLQHEPPPNSRARCETDVLQAEVHMKVNSGTFSEFISSFSHVHFGPLDLFQPQQIIFYSFIRLVVQNENACWCYLTGDLIDIIWVWVIKPP